MLQAQRKLKLLKEADGCYGRYDVAISNNVLNLKSDYYFKKTVTN